MLEYVITFYFIGMAYNVLIRPGELLMHWARFVNFKINNQMTKKLLLCPYCLASQLLLWTLIIKREPLDYYVSIPVLIVLIYYSLKLERP